MSCEEERPAFLAALTEKRAFYGGAQYEESRTAEQKAAFRRALEDTMDVWYAHQGIIAIFVTQMPEGYEGRTYEARGWTAFERSCAELIKPSQPYVVEEGKTFNQGRNLWAMTIDSSASGDSAGRRPPIAPAAFAALLARMFFTRDADKEAVAKLYEKTATTVLGATPKMELDGVPMCEGDGARLAQALALCATVEELSWNFVKIPAEEVRAMLATPVPSLRKLYLQQAGLDEVG